MIIGDISIKKQQFLTIKTGMILHCMVYSLVEVMSTSGFSQLKVMSKTRKELTIILLKCVVLDAHKVLTIFQFNDENHLLSPLKCYPDVLVVWYRNAS